MNNRYENGKIYMIESPSQNLIYYGSTCLSLSKRLSSHKKAAKRYQDGKRNLTTSFKILEYPDHKIVLVENYPCKTKEELVAREAYYIRNNECVNKVIPQRTHKEWYETNKERITADQIEWQKNNKEKLKQYQRDYYYRKKKLISCPISVQE